MLTYINWQWRDEPYESLRQEEKWGILILSLLKMLLLIFHSSLIILHLLLFSTALHSNPTSLNSWTFGHPLTQGFPRGLDSKESLPAMQETQVWSLDREDSLEKGMTGYPFQYSCLENSHGQRSLVGYSPRGRKQLDTAEWLTLSLFHFFTVNAQQERCRQLRPRGTSSNIYSLVMWGLVWVRGAYLKWDQSLVC